MKIFITSDNHLGYKETDPLRGDDSFHTFQEILELAAMHGADIVLQGGDLFHENKPSRNTYNKAFQILRKHCLKSSATEDACDKINPSDVKMRILSIHGNHDDPSGFNSISPLNILESAGLIHYFGRYHNLEDIVVEPIIIENQKVAIFGIGYIKDRKMYALFKNKKITFKRPQGEGWYNILMVHQNRVFRENSYLPEDFIPEFFDLVIYGHEHESIKISHKNFEVIQVGSSVRTSLCEGEAGNKYAYMVTLGKTAAIQRMQLETVRPLKMGYLEASHNYDEKKIIEYAQDMLLQPVNCLNNDEFMDGEAKRQRLPNDLLPLLRINISLSGAIPFNKHAVMEFLEKHVANPHDALRFIKKSKTNSVVAASTKPKRQNEITEIYDKILGECSFNILTSNCIVDSLNEYILKDNKDAFVTLIETTIGGISERIGHENVIFDNINKEISCAKQRNDKREQDK
ncbi:double-strand break repair protein MRE11 [Enteropsectra breve]|nr:double-strand break repair protein MRE11 [Enteropsectra breve]